MPAPMIGKDECAAARTEARERRQDLADGRLLRALRSRGAPLTACPSEARELGVIALEAAASLGDVDALKRWKPGVAPTVSAALLFAPDGPVDTFRSTQEAAAGYQSAVAAYLAGDWRTAAKLGLAVGANGGRLAPEGFILAARSAQRERDAARAARMWARAYRVGCGPGTPCIVQPPREDLFAQTAHLGPFVPWRSESFCSDAINWRTGIVGGVWHVTPSLDERGSDRVAPGGYDIREVPSRVLIEHVDVPTGALLVCFSPNGRRRIATVQTEDGHQSMFFGSMGAGWKGPLYPSSSPEPKTTYVGDDGRAIVRRKREFEIVDPLHETYRSVEWPANVAVDSAALGEQGQLFVVQGPTDNVTTRRRYRVARYDLKTGKSAVVYEADDSIYVGPGDTGNRLLVEQVGSSIWLMDGMTGERLGNAISFSLFVHGLAGGSTVVGDGACNGYRCIHTVNLATGRTEQNVVWLWHPPDGWRRDDDDVSRYHDDHVRPVLGHLPIGTSSVRWSAAHGWQVSPRPQRRSTNRFGAEDTAVQVTAPGREPLRVVLTADKRGAMVIDNDGRFELIGRFSSAFRASASCGHKGTSIPPNPSDRAWPLDVCGAAMEEAGLTDSWFHMAEAVTAGANGAGTMRPLPSRVKR